ncbi:hypothetical protein BJX99DRAFT_271744 [Aspergillus californicus]
MLAYNLRPCLLIGIIQLLRWPPRYNESQEQILADVRQLCPECYQLTLKRHLCNPLCRKCKSYFCPGSGTWNDEQQNSRVQFPDLLSKKLPVDIERGVYRSVIKAMGEREAFANLVHNIVDPDVRALKGQVVSVGVLHAIRLKQISNPTTWEDPHGGYLDFVTQVNLPTYLRTYGRSLSPYTRYKVVQLLSDSPDPEIRDWTLHRNNQSHQLPSLMDHKSYRSALLQAISASLGPEEAHLVQDDEHIWGPLKVQLIDPQLWFQSTINKLQQDEFGIGATMASPVGNPEASIGIVTSIPWSLQKSGFQPSNSLIWPFDLQRYVYLPECFQVQSSSTSKRDILRDVSQELIAGTHLQIIIMCGDIEDVILPTNTKKVSLSLDQMTYNTWVEIQQMKITRMFIRAPIPLFEFWASHGKQAYELTGIFKLVSALTNIKLFPSFHECSMVLALIVRRWANERDGKIPPAKPAGLEPVLRVWFADKGFKGDKSLLRLADTVRGSLRYGLLVLIVGLPHSRRKVPRPRSIFRSKIERRHVIPKAMLDGSPLIEGHDPQGPDPHDEGFIPTMDSLELIDDAEDQYVPTTGEQLNEVPSEKDSPTGSISFRSGLKLLVGNRYQIKKRDCRVNRASFTIQHCTPKLFPMDERHPQAWATAAQEHDPGARLAVEKWWIYASSDSWETSCQANSLVDRFEGNTFVELCTKPRRYIYIDGRYVKLKREHPELIPFVGGAYTSDNMDVIPAKSSRRDEKYSRERRPEDLNPRANKQAKRSGVEELEST